MGSPSWHAKSDEELRAIVRAVWEGRVVGTWQLEATGDLDRVFPGFSAFQFMKAGDESGFPVVFADPHAAAAFAAVPWPAAAFGSLPPREVGRAPTAPPQYAAFEIWEVFSFQEWDRVRRLLHYPESTRGRPRPRRRGERQPRVD